MILHTDIVVCVLRCVAIGPNDILQGSYVLTCHFGFTLLGDVVVFALLSFVYNAVMHLMVSEFLESIAIVFTTVCNVLG